MQSIVGLIQAVKGCFIVGIVILLLFYICHLLARWHGGYYTEVKREEVSRNTNAMFNGDCNDIIVSEYTTIVYKITYQNGRESYTIVNRKTDKYVF